MGFSLNHSSLVLPYSDRVYKYKKQQFLGEIDAYWFS